MDADLLKLSQDVSIWRASKSHPKEPAPPWLRAAAVRASEKFGITKTAAASGLAYPQLQNWRKAVQAKPRKEEKLSVVPLNGFPISTETPKPEKEDSSLSLHLRGIFGFRLSFEVRR
jgi:hypothetical protein